MMQQLRLSLVGTKPPTITTMTGKVIVAEWLKKCRQPGWSANKGAGLITQESIVRTAQQRTKTKSPYNQYRTYPREQALPRTSLIQKKSKGNSC
jgi:hypothetical protein